jgi:ribosomal protein S18 acetylase RimI-like enzyme
MVDMASLQIKHLEEKYLKGVVQIHQNVLSYTFNSLLGSSHLCFMYRTMAYQDESYVGVAVFEDQPVGVISGTLDMDKIKTLLLNSFKPQQWINLVVHTLRRPSLINEWRKGIVIGRAISFEGTNIQPTLTTIAVDASFHGKGIGKHLVYSLESFFKQKNIHYYRLDTLITNSGARNFYKSLGFLQIETRADSVIYIKRIPYE